MVSAVDLAKRAFVKVLLHVATVYGVALSVTRESPAVAIKAAFGKVVVKAHPDNGGNVKDHQALDRARQEWETAVADAPGKGRKRKAPEPQPSTPSHPSVPLLPVRAAKYAVKHFRIQSLAVLLTFQKYVDFCVWFRFIKFIRDHIDEWHVKLWCATMETNADGSYHLHLCLPPVES